MLVVVLTSQIFQKYYLGKKVKIVLKFPESAIIYCGLLKELSEDFIVLDEVKKGFTSISINDISTCYEDDKKKVV